MATISKTSWHHACNLNNPRAIPPNLNPEDYRIPCFNKIGVLKDLNPSQFDVQFSQLRIPARRKGEVYIFEPHYSRVKIIREKTRIYPERITWGFNWKENKS